MATTNSPLPYGIAPPAHRLPDATRIGRVRLQVGDLDRSIAYYETVIGMRLLQRAADRALLGPHGEDVVLLELHERRGARAVARRGHIGLYHFAILLPDRPVLGRFVAHLASVGAHAGMSDHFVSEAVYLQDPDGLGIEVYADRPRSAWRHEDRQLTMTTIPLDVRDLVASANGQRWDGLPAGTRIGHVHLHVRDIAEAEAFYHHGLGLDKTVWNYPGALFLSAGGYHHHLGTNTWAAAAATPTPEDAQLLEWEIVVPEDTDVIAAGESLRARGYDIENVDGKIVARDPWGTQLRVVSAAHG